MLQVYRQYDAYASLSNVDSVDAERRKVVRYVLLLESCVAYLSHLTRISLRAYLVQYLLSVIRGLDLVLTFGVWGGSPLPFPGYHTPRLKQRLI
jgi:hypothetical protein